MVFFQSINACISNVMQQCRGCFRERDVNNDPEIIATITRSVKRGGSGKRRRGRSLFPAPRVFRLHFHDRFPLLHYSNLEPATG